MPGEKRIYIGFFLLICLILNINCVSGLPPGFCFPQNGTYIYGIYTPGYPGNANIINASEFYQDFQIISGKKSTIGVITNEWIYNPKFPADIALNFSRNGITPYILLMTRSSDVPYQKEPIYTLQNIADGKFDQYLKQWARDAKTLGIPIFVEFGNEVNQWKYPWNGYWNREEKGTETFKEAYRHIHDIMVQEGASNLIWVYHVNANSQPSETWNTITSYYPGNDYCDLISVSVFGTQNPFETGTGPLSDAVTRVISNLSSDSIQKPVFLIIGTDVHNRILDPADWIKDIFTSLSQNTWPSVKGLIWYNAGWKNDENPLHDTSMRLKDNVTVENAYKEGINEISIGDSLKC